MIKTDKLYNTLVSVLALIGVYSTITPYFFGGVYDVNHRLLLMISILSMGVFLWKRRLVVSKYVFIAILVICFSGLNVFISLGTISLAYATKWLIFAGSLMIYCVTISGVGKVSYTTMSIIYVFTVLQSIVHFVHSFNSRYFIKMWSGTYLQLAFANKNAAAMQLLLLGCMFVLFIRRSIDLKEYKRLVLSFVLLICIIWMIYRTGSRSSLIAIAFVIPFVFIERLYKIIRPKTILLFLLFPALFASLYILIYKAGYMNLSLIGRGFFNGRELMWLRVFEGFPRRWAIGMYSDFTKDINAVDFQLHNGIIDLIASYGIFVTGAYLWLAYKVLCRILEIGGKTNIIIITCVLALVIQSTGEAALMYGSRAIFVSQLFLFCSLPKNEESLFCHRTHSVEVI